MDEIRIKLTCLDKIVFAIVAVLAAIVLILILFGCSTPSFERGIDAGADAGDAGDAGDDGSVDSDADAGPDAATDTDSDTPPFDVCEDINMPEFGCCYHGTLYRCPDYGWPDYDDTLLIEDCNAEAEETGHDIHCCAMSSMGGMGCALISM